MPRVQDALPSLGCRAWKGRSNPLLLSVLRFAPESRGRSTPSSSAQTRHRLVMSLIQGPLAALEISRRKRHSPEVGNVARSHLLNARGPGVFGRPRADAQLVSDELGRQPLQEKGEDLPLALCQQRLPGLESLHFEWSVASLVAARQRFLDGGQQRLGVEGLLDKMKGSRLHR